MTSTSLVGYLAVFAITAFATIFVGLLLGWFLRPRHPSRVKKEIYECGEETIGSSRTQFDLRFYVVALVFLIFEVELAFFFPWGLVYGRAAQLGAPATAVVGADGLSAGNDRVAVEHGRPVLTEKTRAAMRELGITDPQLPIAMVEGTSAEVSAEQNAIAISESGRRLMRLAMVDMAVFFAVLMVGFAYVWKRGDLDWVRAYGRTNH
ncbi:MAG: NADH-quinone oxidoreductase subunit A [Planctomycetia bacterium]|nr:NADH-quinone oxidoreductase subunit A [Planctomycetia bacterium]